MTRLRLLAAPVLATLAVIGVALAHETTVDNLTISHPWARASAGNMANGAAYMVIINEGTDDDRLVAAATPAADRAELHTHLMEDGVMKMRQVEAIDVPADGDATLEPGGFHLMLMGLAAPLVEGESFPVTLTFEQAGDVEIEVKVEAVGAMGGSSMDGSSMDHNSMDHGTTEDGAKAE